MESVFALVDCNNFYASCERIFRPDLEEKPIMVLSNNDGIVIARSQEVKDLGIPMGAPVFKYRELIKKHNIHTFSSNFSLYGDISGRVMSVLASFTPSMEVYSVDEAFLSLNGMRENLTEYGKVICQTVKKWVGVPVSVGIAPTKTLAKAANELAKKNKCYKGVLNMCNLSENEKNILLASLEIGEVWGIGRRYAAFLKSRQIRTAFDFICLEDRWIKRHMGICGMRTAMELRGQSCIELNDMVEPRKSILCSRSFEKSVEDIETLKQALAGYVARAAEKLREQGSVTSGVYVFLNTSRFAKEERYFNHKSLVLHTPTAHTGTLIETAYQIIESIFKPGYKHKKIGVLFFQISADKNYQLSFFTQNYYNDKKRRLMKALDQINTLWGSEALFYAAEGTGKDWVTEQLYRSPRYTTHWEDIQKVH